MIMDKKCVQCTLVGDGMVGKTCLALSFIGELADSEEDYVATVFENYAGNVAVAGEKYTISIFDSAGQHDYASLRAFTYKDSEVFVLCYSVIDRESFNSIKSFWVPELKEFVGRKRPILLVGTQTDCRYLHEDGKTVSKKEGEELAKDIGAEGYFESASFTSEGVRPVFDKVVLSALKYRKKKSKILQRIFGDR
ncbi:hypothetical protein KUTeg_014383 [Tegillarca granosa]|uniref:Uncharacterized protein n=1 Tax=Tegillarca granosa TaxID=220873 RepID=A0ABQ9EWS8_TEGGR|nr:hypothetical protein KUTeg_014383 [Tegillarca granosa]